MKIKLKDKKKYDLTIKQNILYESVLFTPFLSFNSIIILLKWRITYCKKMCVYIYTIELVLWSRFFMNWGFILVNTACEWKLNISQNSYLWSLYSPLITPMLVIVWATLSIFTAGTFVAVSKLECKFKAAVDTIEHLLHLFWILRLEIF